MLGKNLNKLINAPAQSHHVVLTLIKINKFLKSPYL